MKKFSNFRNITLTLFLDFIILMISWYIFFVVRRHLTWLPQSYEVPFKIVFIRSIVITSFWLLILAVFGLYQNLYLISRFDEIVRIMKATIIGTLILFFLLFLDSVQWNSRNIYHARTYVFIYWMIVAAVLSINRFIIRSIQKYRVSKGKDLHKAIIVGSESTVGQVYESIKRHKASGMQVLGYVGVNGNNYSSVKFNNDSIPYIGHLVNLRNIVIENGIQDVIVALKQEDSRHIVNIIDQVDMSDIKVKILPDFYQVITGLNQTNQIFGLPLIEIMPDPMPTWEKFIKRAMDIIFAVLILSVTLPLSVLVAILIKVTSKGPVVFCQTRVGLHGREFTMYKFRTMYDDAEKHTGPVWAQKNDRRITPVGFWLRKLRLDELPQFLNVIKGDMSLVGPRPERSYFVEKFKNEIPLYSRRLRVRPGITGWAQVKWKYDSNIDDVREKIKYDLFYVENISLRMDFKILINTIFTVLSGKGQ